MGLSASAITSSSATISWTAVTTGSFGYQYIINSSSATPVVSGTSTATATVNATGLTPGTGYYAHVRDSCGVGDFSGWTSIPFTTLLSVGVVGATSTQREVLIAPNPMTDVLSVIVGGAPAGEAVLELISLSGNVLHRVVMTGNGVRMDVSRLAKGMYLLRYTDAGYATTMKVSKL
jgi:hypothetical protein